MLYTETNRMHHDSEKSVHDQVTHKKPTLGSALSGNLCIPERNIGCMHNLKYVVTDCTGQLKRHKSVMCWRRNSFDQAGHHVRTDETTDGERSQRLMQTRKKFFAVTEPSGRNCPAQL